MLYITRYRLFNSGGDIVDNILDILEGLDIPINDDDDDLYDDIYDDIDYDKWYLEV